MDILLFASPEPFPGDAVALVQQIAGMASARVTVLFVGLRDEDRQAGERTLAEVQRRLAPVPVRMQFRRGATTGRLVAESQEREYDFVVLEMRQISHLQRVLTGSRVRSVMRHSYGSVLVAKGSRPALRRVLICTSGFPGAVKVIEQGARLAQAAAAQVTLLYVASSFPTMYTGLPRIDEDLATLLGSDTPVARHLRLGAEILARHGLEPRLELRHGVVADEILLEASEGEDDLIVMGAPSRQGWLFSWLMGDVAWQVVERAEGHVLVVRRPDVVFESPD